MQKIDAEGIIKELGLSPLAHEGGWFKRTWESKVEINNKDSQRSGSAIYYLITPEQFSAFHKIGSDEIFHFYYGDPVEIQIISPEGELETSFLGTDFDQNQRPQKVIPAKHWQALRCKENHYGFSLMGCSVSPEFIWEEFEIGSKKALCKEFPHLADTINQFTS